MASLMTDVLDAKINQSTGWGVRTDTSPPQETQTNNVFNGT